MEGLEMNFSFWRGKRVFLTGHTGFKGSWLSLWLQELGADVTGFALQPCDEPSLYETTDAGACMTSVIGDIRDASALKTALLAAKPEIVIHMAAQSLVRRSYQDPVETYSTNVIGLVNLFEAVRSAETVRALLNVTTDKCYENREWVWGYRENEPMGGHDPYSSSKACAELVTAAYRSSYFSCAQQTKTVALATARAGNVIGGGDWAQDRLIPDMLRAFSARTPAVIRNPGSIRPWQYVLEPLRGYLMLAEHLYEQGDSFAQAWNFGPDEKDAKPVFWIAKNMARLWGTDVEWKIDDAGIHPHEARYLKLDISKARNNLGWHPVLRLEDTLQGIVDWTQKWVSGHNMRDVTLAQIRSYQTHV